MSGYADSEKIQYALKTALYRTMQTAMSDSASVERSAPLRVFPTNIMKVNIIEAGKGDIGEDGLYVTGHTTAGQTADLSDPESTVKNYKIICPVNNVITSITISALVGFGSSTKSFVDGRGTSGTSYPLKQWFFRGHYSGSGEAAFNAANGTYHGLQLAWNSTTNNTTPSEADIVPHLKYYLQVQTNYTGVSHSSSADNITYEHGLLKGLIGLDSNFVSTIMVTQGEGGPSSSASLGTSGSQAGDFWFTQSTAGIISFYGVTNKVDASTDLATFNTKFPMVSYVRYTGETGFGAGTGGGGSVTLASADSNVSNMIGGTAQTMTTTSFNFDANVGIGTTNPISKLSVYQGGITLDNTVATYSAASVAATANSLKPFEIRATTGSLAGDWGILRLRAGGGTYMSTCSFIDIVGYNSTDSTCIKFFTYNNERMRINSSGNVGIGTTSPSKKLHVNGDVLFHQTYVTKLVHHEYSGTGIWFDTANTLRFIINNSEKMRLNSSGNVGIGTTSPTELLTVGNNSTTNTGGTTSMSILAPGENADAILYFGTQQLSGESEAKKAAIIAEGMTSFSRSKLHFCLDNTADNSSTYNASLSNSRMTIQYDGNVGIGTTSPKSGLQVIHDQGLTISGTATTGVRTAVLRLGSPYTTDVNSIENYCAKITSTNNHTQNYGSDLRFFTHPNGQSYSGSPYQPTERMCILDDGNVGIGTTSPDQKLEVNGWISRSAHGSGGFCGSYNNIGGNAAKTNPIYVIGSAYKPTDTTFENMYGIGYCHSYESGTGDDTNWPRCGPYDGWGFYVASDGQPRIFMSADVTGPEICMRGSHPTIAFRDTNHRGAFIHVNSNIFYILRGEQSTDSSDWQAPSGRSWPFMIDLETNNTSIGGDLCLNPDNTQPYDGTGYYGLIKWSTSSNSDYYCIVPVKYNETTNYGTANYTKLRINWHTGVQIGGHKNYGGTSFWDDALELAATPAATKIAAIGDDGYTWFDQNVGIGTTSPGYPLEVTGATRTNAGAVSYISYPTLSYTSNATNDDITIKASNSIWAGQYVLASSDERIKKNIVDVPDNLALEMVRNIPVRYYEYKNTLVRGFNKTIGFIAQDVIGVLPMAVSLQKNIIPNEMRNLDDLRWNDTTLYTDLSDCSGITYRFYVGNDPSGNDECKKEIIGNEDNTFTFDTSYNNVFCYGKEVDDFHTLDKNKLFALNFSATQELDRKVIALETKNTELENEVATLKSELAAIKQHLGI